MKLLKYIILFNLLLVVNVGVAKEIIVTSTNDGGITDVGTFRWAVDQAQLNDTIIINVKGTITLNSVINFTKDNLTIIGPYPKHNTFKNNGTLMKLFVISSNNLIFKGLGFVGSTNSAEIIDINSSNNIIFDKCLFENNTCQASNIFNTYNSDNIQILNCTFKDNSTPVRGGAIFMAVTSNSSIINNTFINNTANLDGGAIYVLSTNSSTVSIYNNLFTQNNSNNDSGEAIRINNTNANVNLFGNVFFQNGTSNQIVGPFNDQGGNRIKLNSPPSYPFTDASSSTIINISSMYLSSLIEDGYGLKYYRITNSSSVLINCANAIINPLNKDCRRAPRYIGGQIDAGPCEFTPFRVININNAGPGSLPYVLSNLTGGSPYFIEFDISPFNATNPIGITVPLSITNANTYIDGYSQPGTIIPGPQTSSTSGVTPAGNLIQINATQTNIGFNIIVSNVTIAGFEIYGANQKGIDCSTATKIYGCHIGFYDNGSGYTVSENKNNGINVDANDVIIGGNEHWQRNVVTGNGQTGTTYPTNIYVNAGANNGPIIYGNFIGTHPNGIATLTNTGSAKGIFVFGNSNKPNNLKIGGGSFGSRNIISGNAGDGIYIQNNIGTDNTIDNNYIGVDYYGNTALANGTNGIYILNGFNPINIGSLKGNVISGNSNVGIYIYDHTPTTSGFIENNIIGLGVDSTTIVSNNIGINVSVSGTNIFIGTPNKSNIISGNSGEAVLVNQSDGITVGSNLIGTNGAGTQAKPNGASGVHFTNTDGCKIKYNVISGNNGDGVLLDGTGTNTQVFGNFIGLDITGQNAIANGEDGIDVEGTHQAFIGADFPNNNNVISGNTKSGIHVNGGANVLIAGNNIGLIKDQTSTLGNQEHGIYLTSADNVTIGNINSNTYNVISANNLSGIMLDGSNNTSIFNCIIGTNSLQTLLNAGNGENGIYASQCDNHNIGVTAQNVIVNHHANNGILLETVINDTIQNNYIGVSNNNGSTLSNGVGINVIGTSSNNIIGGVFATQKNKIGGNTTGIKLDGANVNDNFIVGNSIGLVDSLGNIVSKPNDKGIEIINNANNNKIGEAGFTSKKNVISGNQTGIYLNDVANTFIYRNWIGSDTTNTGAILNNYGIYIDNCSAVNNIGLTANLTDGPIISGNNIGVLLDASDNQVIQNCRIGTKVGGTQELSNTHGIVIQNSSTSNTIGGSGSYEGNLISGNDSIGIAINSCNNNFIYGNYIGTNINSTDSLPNWIGIYVNGSNGNYIGSTLSGQENLINSNSLAGILMENGSNNNHIVSNFFGTNSTGDGIYANSGNLYGVLINMTTGNNTIGGNRTIGEGNTFSNTNGVSIGVLNTTANQYVEGNKIGITYDGSQTITTSFTPNTFGIYVHNSSNVTIGGTSTGVENSIANLGAGIMLSNNSNSNTVSHNFIGNDTTGTNMLTVAPQGIGIRIDSAATNNTIGPNNVISGNTTGILIKYNGTNNNTIKNNKIGTNAGGTSALANATGIKIADGASQNIIGGTVSEANIISGNTSYGINIDGTNTNENKIKGNIIGLNTNGNSSIANNFGIYLSNSASNNTIGGVRNTNPTLSETNTISGNSSAITLLASSNNIIAGNNIGTSLAGTNTIANTGTEHFSLINGSNNNIIGGFDADSTNYIVGSNTHGIQIGDAVNTANGNKIIGNHIGVKPDGTAAGNAGDGIAILKGNNNIILNNIIQNNTGLAIDIYDGASFDGPDDDNTTSTQQGIDPPKILQAFDCSGGNNNNPSVALRLSVNIAAGNFIVQFYKVGSTPDPTGYGEAKELISQTAPFLMSSSVDTLNFTLPNINDGEIITATLTSLTNGGTSEFAKNDTVTTTPTFNNTNIATTTETCKGANNGSFSVTAPDLGFVVITTDSVFSNANGVIINNKPAGTYNVKMSYINGCETTVNGIVLPEGTKPTFSTNIVNDTCGLGGQIEFTNVNLQGTLSPTYTIDNGTNFQASNTFNNLPSGTYSNVFMTTTSSGQTCYSDTTTVTITSVDLTSQMSFTYSDFCASDTGKVSVQPLMDYGTYSVTPPPGNFDASTGQITNATVGDNYTITYTYGNTCSTTQTATALTPVDASFTYDGYALNQLDTLCFGEQLAPTVQNPGGTFSIAPVAGIGNPTIGADGVINADIGNYIVEYVTDNTGCPDTVDVTVTILALPPQPNISTTDSIICIDETPSQLTTQNPVNWYDNPTGTALATNVNQFQPPTNLQFGVTTFYAYYFDANGCASPYDSINIIRPDLSTLNVSPDSIAICLGSEVELDATNPNAVSYLWSKNNGIEDSTEPSIIVSPSTDTYYNVQLIDVNGCWINDTVFVYIKDPSECNIETYTAFSPNGDNVNDTWIIDGIEGYKENTVYIYNRWGDLIQKIENYDNSTNVWDGSIKNSNTKAIPGTYFYIVEANGTKALSGWVQIVK